MTTRELSIKIYREENNCRNRQMEPVDNMKIGTINKVLEEHETENALILSQVINILKSNGYAQGYDFVMQFLKEKGLLNP